ncbi:hypothetical protein [Hydrogenophaga sp. T2]|uniref:hypothetical protein n=1 Tax=Hydrogenophaga sp. T2 TaxID=3132823 RepID=UPI003CF72A5A
MIARNPRHRKNPAHVTEAPPVQPPVSHSNEELPPLSRPLVHVEWLPTTRQASVNIRRTHPGPDGDDLSQAIAFAVQSRLKDAIAQASQDQGQAICRVADALVAFIGAFRLPLMTAITLIDSDEVWDALHGCDASSFELVTGFGDADGADVRFARQDDAGPDTFKALAAMLRVLLDGGDTAWARRVFQACRGPVLRSQVRSRLPLTQRPLFNDAAPDATGPGPAEPARDKPLRAQSNPIVRQEWRASRRLPPPNPHSPVRSTEGSPRAGAPSHWRKSRALSLRVDAAAKAASTLKALEGRLGADLQMQWALKIDASDRIDAVARWPDACLSQQAFLHIARQLEVSRDTAHLYLPLIDTLLQWWQPAEGEPDQPTLDALDHLRAICDLALQNAPARGDLVSIEQAFQTLARLYARRSEPADACDFHRARVVGEALQMALFGHCDPPAIVCLLNCLAPIEAPGAMVRIFTATAKTFSSAKEALDLLTPLSLFLTTDDGVLSPQQRALFTDLVLQRLPKALMKLLVPAPARGQEPIRAPEDTAVVARLAQWVWLGASLASGFDGEGQPALVAYWHQRLGAHPEARLCLHRLPPPGAPAEAAGTPAAMDDLRRQLQAQIAALPEAMQLTLAFVDPGPQGLNLDGSGVFSVASCSAWLLASPNARALSLHLLQWHRQQGRLAIDEGLAQALLQWAETPGDTIGLQFVQTLRRDRNAGPAVAQLFDALLKASGAPRPDTWTPAQSAMLATLARGVVPSVVTVRLIGFMDHCLRRRREASNESAAGGATLDDLLPALLPLLPYANSAASIQLLRALSFEGPEAAQWTELGKRLVFADSEDFKGWYRAVNLFVLDDSMNEMLSTWLLVHPETVPANPVHQALRQAVTDACDHLRSRNQGRV